MNCPSCLHLMAQAKTFINEITGARRDGYVCPNCSVKWEKIFICNSYPNDEWVYTEGIKVYKEDKTS